MKTQFEVGDMLVYGNTGVCQVVDKCMKSTGKIEDERLFYVLKPLYQDGTITVPVDTKMFIRSVISAPEAQNIIEKINEMEALPYHDRNFNQLAAYYDKALSSPEFTRVVELALSLHKKKVCAERDRKKLGQIDMRYLRRVENLLYGEFSVALGVEKEEAEEMVRERIERCVSE